MPVRTVFSLLLAAALPLAAQADEVSADRVMARAAVSAKAGPTEAQVGDIDSFGRSLTWLGVTDGAIALDQDCSTYGPDEACQPLAPGGAATAFAFEDLGRIELPARATKSLLCYWFSPTLTVGYANPGPTPVVARLYFQPTLTIENPVLATPGLIDPTTGAPFGGRLTTGMTSTEDMRVPLPAGVAFTERTRDSAVCIAGFLTRKSLVELYGLSEAQVRDFFRQPTTVRLNVSGGAQYVDFASLYFGLRIIGD